MVCTFMESSPSRVFVSSVIDGFAAHREAARAAIEQAGAEPVLVNEDFPSLAGSSRNTCLDAIDSCDIFLLILGARGGWRAPSGRLVVEEEFEHARAAKLPVLVFLENVARDPDAQLLARNLSDYVDGHFRVKFSGPAELQAQIECSLRAMVGPDNGPMDHDPIAAYLLKPHRFADEAALRFGIAPERVEEVFDPLDLTRPDFAERMMELAHHRDVRLFGYRYAKEGPQFSEDWLVIEQPLGNDWSSGRQGVRLAIGEQGLILIDTNLTGRGARRNSFDMASVMTIALEDIEAALDTSFRFVRALYDEKDPYKRHQRFYWNATLSTIGHRSLVRGQVEQRQYAMNMSDRNEPLPAFTASRLMGRADLAQPMREIERAVLYWQRQRGER